MKIGVKRNENGVLMTEYECDTCKTRYTICPSPENDEAWQNCLAADCESYDPARDIDWMFPDDPKVTPIKSPDRR